MKQETTVMLRKELLVGRDEGAAEGGRAEGEDESSGGGRRAGYGRRTRSAS